jgi:hypothetical protein
MSPDLERAAHDELVLLVAAGLACAMVALGARAVPVRRETREGLAIGVVLAFVVELVPRLTANTTVGWRPSSAPWTSRSCAVSSRRTGRW